MPTTKERDTQRKKLYAAEKLLETYSKRVESIEEIVDYVNKCLARATVCRRFTRELARPIRVHDGRGRSNACGGTDYIKMPTWSRTQYIVLHEIAHVICQRRHTTNVAGHGWQYAGIYLDLVRFCMGAQAGEALKASFKAARVRFRPKKGSADGVIERHRAKTRAIVQKRTAVITIDDLLDTTRLRALKQVAVPAPHLAAKPKVKRKIDRQYQAFRALARTRGFTYKVDHDSYIETSGFSHWPQGWTTFHYDWSETLHRLERCLADPSLVDEDGYYGE